MIQTLGNDGFMATGTDVRLVQMRAQRSALSLEIKGMTRRGRSIYSLIKQQYGLKGNKERVMEQFTRLIQAYQNKPSIECECGAYLEEVIQDTGRNLPDIPPHVGEHFFCGACGVAHIITSVNPFLAVRA